MFRKRLCIKVFIFLDIFYIFSPKSVNVVVNERLLTGENNGTILYFDASQVGNGLYIITCNIRIAVILWRFL